jgi:hypothetical protein
MELHIVQYSLQWAREWQKKTTPSGLAELPLTTPIPLPRSSVKDAKRETAIPFISNHT